MAKEDVPPLGPVPKKRRQLEAALDVHVAMWLASDDLTPSERRRVGEEKARRRVRTVPVVLGYSGAREGMTPQQRAHVAQAVASLEPVEAHHGDCVGGDEQFHSICLDQGVPVVLHPPTDSSLRAFCEGAARVERAKPYLERNKDIVRSSTVVYATPKEHRQPADPRGSGTWSTVRYARSRESNVKVVRPDGELDREEQHG